MSVRHPKTTSAHTRRRTMSLRSGLMVVTLLAALLVPLVPGIADVSDTISVIKEGEELSNAEIVARLAEATFVGQTNRVLIGRENAFADSMASAVMQADSPLLLVPTDGPISDRVLALLDEYQPSEVVLLGGSAAVSAGVEQELAADYDIVRRSGPTRFETAIDIAENEATTADTAILARGFGSEGSNDASQAFADSLAAGGWAADQRWPILLTGTDELPATVEAYLTRSSIRNVMIMGGTAAISAGVQQRLEDMDLATTRISGATRFDTAIAVADARGVSNAGDADRVVLVEGQDEDAWAGGFAAAAHSAAFNAPVVLANGSSLPGPTGSFLSGGAGFAQTDFFADAVLTCAAAPSACEEARVARGLPASASVTFDPASGSTVEAGSPIAATTASSGTPAATLSGDCIATATGTAPTTLTAGIDPAFSGTCTVTNTLALATGSSQVDVATYTVTPSVGVSGIVTNFQGEGYDWVPGASEVFALIGTNDTFTIDGNAATRSAFETQITRGDLVTQRTGPFAQTVIEHGLTNRLPADYSTGVLGDVNTAGNTAAIIEPVSGYALRTFTYGGGLFSVDGTTTTEATFEGEASEGDTVTLQTSASNVLTTTIINDDIQGPLILAGIGTGDATFRINSGGLTDSPMIGDDPLSLANGSFTASSQNPNQAFTVDGQTATYIQFTTALNDGDSLRYLRTGGTETFHLVNAVAPARTGLATESYDFGVNQLTILYSDTGRTLVSIDAAATYSVDAITSTRAEFISNYTAGDQIGIRPAATGTPQAMSLTNRTVQGTMTTINTSDNFYTVSTPAGVLFNTLSYFGDPFGVGQNGHAFYIDGTEVTQVQFEAALDAVATGVTPAVQTIAGGTAAALGLRNEHRLTSP